MMAAGWEGGMVPLSVPCGSTFSEGCVLQAEEAAAPPDRQIVGKGWREGEGRQGEMEGRMHRLVLRLCLCPSFPVPPPAR